MALFNKKKSQPAAAPDAVASSTSDDFSEFSPEALAGGTDAAAGDDGSSKKRKGKKGAAKGEAKTSSGRAIKPGTAIGLNIGNDSIKVLEASAKGNDITITAMGMVPTPPDSISNGVVMSANALVVAIRDAMAQAGIKSKKVVTSISGTGALVVRIIEVPKMSDGELLDNMKMDADRYIPFPPSEVEMDFKALRELPSDPDSPNMEVLLAAAQREIIDLHVQVLQDAKLDPRAIDVEPLAVARAVTHPLTARPANGVHANGDHANGSSNGAAAIGEDVDYNDVSAILNIGASGMEISILRGDLLVFTRTVPTGGNSLTQAMVDTLGLAWNDAEQLKREMGDALPPTADASTPIAGSATTAADDLNWNAGDDNDDWSSFNDDESATEADATSAAAPSDASSADPFEDEFFQQGPSGADPVNAEPGEQHQQKEPDNSGASDDVAPTDTPVSPPAAKPFFDFGDEEPQDEIPTLKDEAPAGYADLLGKEEDDFSELPTLTPDAPPATSLPSAFDFPGESAPPPARSAASSTDAEADASDATLPTFEGAPASTEAVGDGTRVDPEDATVLPSEAAPAPFTFSFGEPSEPDAPATPATPATSSESAAPAPSSESAASPFDFGLDTPEEASPPAPESAAAAAEADPFAEFMASAGESPAPPTSAPAAPATAPAAPAAAGAADDFDLDSLFGGAAAPAAAGTGAVGAAAGASDSTLDLDDFGLGGDAATDDFSADLADFGVGLGGASVGEIDAQSLYEVLEPSLENLVNEVRRSLEYHTTRYPDAAVRNVTVVGGGAKLKNLDAYLTQKLGLPVTVGNPAQRLGQNTPKLPPGYTDEHGTVFTVALGLAMRELTK